MLRSPCFFMCCGAWPGQSLFDAESSRSSPRRRCALRRKPVVSDCRSKTSACQRSNSGSDQSARPKGDRERGQLRIGIDIITIITVIIIFIVIIIVIIIVIFVVIIIIMMMMMMTIMFEPRG